MSKHLVSQCPIGEHIIAFAHWAASNSAVDVIQTRSTSMSLQTHTDGYQGTSPQAGGRMSNRRLKLVGQGGDTGSLMPRPLKPPRIPRLDCAQGWLTEIGNLYRAARRGQMESSEASRLAFIANVGSKLAASVEELRRIGELQAAVEKIQASQGEAAAYGDHDVIEGERSALNGSSDSTDLKASA